MTHCRAAIAAAALTLAAASTGLGADTIFWTTGSNVGRADLSGANPGTLDRGSPSPAGVYGLTVDPASGRLVWPTRYQNKIGAWSLGTSGLEFLTPPSPATAQDALGASFVPSTGRTYWLAPNASATTEVQWMAAGGSDGGVLANTAVAANPSSFPSVVADTQGGRLYWTNTESDTIGYASITGQGGAGTLMPDASACPNIDFIASVISDAATGTVYFGGKTTASPPQGFVCRISAGVTSKVADVAGSVFGLAFDPRTSRLYTAGSGIRYIDVPGDATATVLVPDQAPAPAGTETYAVVLKAPTPSPAVTGASTPGAVLTCTPGMAEDYPGLNLYQSPATTTYAWSRDGSVIAGATSEAFTASEAGSYTCTVTGTNAAGSRSVASAAHVVTATSSGGGSGGGATPRSEYAVKIPAAAAKTGLIVSASGSVRLPLTCPPGVPGGCDASGRLSVNLPGSVQFGRGKDEQATRVRVLAQFKGVQIASGSTRLYAVRLAPRTYNALRAAGIRRIPANLRIANALSGGAPVMSSQRIWLRIKPLLVPVTG